MAFDGVVTKAVVTELNKTLKGAKVNKVLEPNKNEIILELYNNEKYYLEINISVDSCRIGLTKHLKPNPQNAFNFCMLLRKYLIGSKILDISSYDLERTIELKFEGYNELNDLVKRKLYIEIMSRQSNVILTNEKGIIVDALRHFENQNRSLLPAHSFSFAPIQKSSFIEIETFDDFLELIAENGEDKLSCKLPEIFIGFSKNLVLKALEELHLSDENYNDVDLEKLYNYFKELIQKIDLNKVEATSFNKDFTLILSNKQQDKLQVNKFIDEYYFYKEQRNLFNSSKNNLLKIISSSLKKVYKKLENINLKLKECDEMDKYRLYGELLTANLYRLEGNKNLSQIEVFNYYTNENIIIKLDSKINISKNVEKFYKKYNKLKNTLNIVSEQKKEAEREIDYIESIIYSLDSSKTMEEIDEIYDEISENFISKKEINLNKKGQISSKKSKEVQIESQNILGYKVYIGKNNKQNDYLTLKFASKDDIWFHTQKIHGSHVILKTNGKEEIADEVLYECAKLAKENSKGKQATNVAVDYCFVKYIKRSQTGKLGMVNYTNYNTIIVK
jgi:predicted ribosome quality control (RQC) complex YloA/Tae2 family protein